MARKLRTYYSLLVKLPNGVWTPEFGDYTRDVVAQEGDDMKEGSTWIKGSKLKIIATGDKQQDIYAAIDALNKRIAERANA